ncbi:MAG: reverse transcriptase domain-containing protein [Patescibacteria group bacterium]
MYSKIFTFKNLLKSYYQARANKRTRRNLQKIELHFEDILIDLAYQLETFCYQPKPYHQFLVHEPKLRQISAPAFQDRIVQHAIVNVIEPIFDKQFIPASFACRKGKGNHKCLKATAKTYSQITQNHPRFYAFKSDIKSYFASIDHQILINLLSKSIRCQKTLKLLITIINSYHKLPNKGIPIGNLTSQLFANIYLHPLDIFVTKTLKVPNYFRYMDDFVILSADKDYLIDLREKIKAFAQNELKLKLHPRKSNIFRADRGLDYVGFMIKPDGISMRKKTVRRYKKRHKKRLEKLQQLKQQLKHLDNPVQPSLFADFAISNKDQKLKLKQKISALKEKLRASRNSFKGFLKYSQYKRLKTGGVEIGGIVVPKIFPKK